ncbi:MAG: hypothetical protein WBQ24_01880 [Xanthobacteraceae bacterium]|jgi:hypothetical protein
MLDPVLQSFIEEMEVHFGHTADGQDSVAHIRRALLKSEMDDSALGIELFDTVREIAGRKVPLHARMQAIAEVLQKLTSRGPRIM